MLNYQKKYLKYKMKYLELKNQIGGIPGFSECSFVIHNQENARQAYKCKDIEHKDFNIKDLKKFQIKDLRVAGIDKDKTAIPNFTSDRKYIGFSAIELKAAGFSARDFKNGNDAINQAYPKDAHNIRFSAKELSESGFSLKELKEAGFSVKELWDNSGGLFRGFNAEKLKAVGFSGTELKEGGFSITGVSELFTEKELKALGFNAKEFINLLIYLDQYKNKPKQFENNEKKKAKLTELGFTPKEIEDAFK
jgi:intracellular multiplication protein IcmE